MRETIFVSNFISETISSSSGLVLFGIISEKLDAGLELEVSFKSMLRPSSTFLNSSLVRVCVSYPSEVRSNRVKISGLSKSNGEYIQNYLRIVLSEQNERKEGRD